MPKGLEMFGVGYAQALLAWSATYIIHGLLLTLLVWAIIRYRHPNAMIEELLWRAALFGAPITATLGVLATQLEAENDAVFGAALGQNSTFAVAVALLWTVWVLAAIAAVTRSALRTRRSYGNRTRLDAPWARDLIAQILPRAMAPRVVLTTSPLLMSPAAIGRWEICLPEHLTVMLSDVEQRAILAHEAAHIGRRDPLWRFAADVVTLAFPFQPFARFARKRLADLSEFACDDDAVRTTRDRKSLVHALIALSEVRFNDPACAATFASKPSRLVQRIERIAAADMNDAPTHSGRHVLQLVAFALGVASISLPAATLRPEQAVNHIPWLAPSTNPTPAALEIVKQQRDVRDAQRRMMRSLF